MSVAMCGLSPAFLCALTAFSSQVRCAAGLWEALGATPRRKWPGLGLRLLPGTWRGGFAESHVPSAAWMDWVLASVTYAERCRHMLRWRRSTRCTTTTSVRPLPARRASVPSRESRPERQGWSSGRETSQGTVPLHGVVTASASGVHQADAAAGPPPGGIEFKHVQMDQRDLEKYEADFFPVGLAGDGDVEQSVYSSDVHADERADSESISSGAERVDELEQYYTDFSPDGFVRREGADEEVGYPVGEMVNSENDEQSFYSFGEEEETQTKMMALAQLEQCTSGSCEFSGPVAATYNTHGGDRELWRPGWAAGEDWTEFAAAEVQAFALSDHGWPVLITEKGLMELVDTLDRAIRIVSNVMSKSPAAFNQMNTSNIQSMLQGIGDVLDAAGFSGKDKTNLAAEVYQSQSGGILDVLEDMKEKVQGQLNDLRKAEVNNRQNEMMKQSLEDLVKTSVIGSRNEEFENMILEGLATNYLGGSGGEAAPAGKCPPIMEYAAID